MDEVGCLPLDPLAANLFFQLVCARYEKGSLILTSNKSFGEWGELLGDPVLATAVRDRLLHHSHLVNICGNSYRLKEKPRSESIRHQAHIWVKVIPVQVGQIISGVDIEMFKCIKNTISKENTNN